ncbi:MAG: fluoride efflux transporter CrcB [Alphaproteobacteria bacterium]|nr:fluoride efflux transporter CrcB [Alphaproteobacteria bacterium]MCD8520218.1 fluoride efflux transporter CrcB [Alphaproteobacteria bacterium]MCD8525926.1 fluoride efflux transporter CrcB [Alphaproteobacteria bacterium]MCD8570451.1 fluoride efflux transporter CrcB [Alphaproteobacteria bacterium]
MISSLLAIGLGGALGAVARYGASSGIMTLFKTYFPYGTLCVNVLGSFAIGLLIAIFAHYGNPSRPWQMFLVTGFLGGFTTFSTFSLDAMTLITRGHYLESALYMSGSLVFSILAVFAGAYLGGRMIG